MYICMHNKYIGPDLASPSWAAYLHHHLQKQMASLSWQQERRDQYHPQTACPETVPAQQQPCQLRPQLW